MFVKLSGAFILILLSLPSPLYAHEALTRFLNTLETLQAQFEQKLSNESGDLLETSQGEVHIKRPNQFRWDYQKPYQQLIVADGKKVWIYDHDLEQVTVKKFDEALGKTPALLLSSNRQAIEEDFFVIQMTSQTGQSRFELIPKDAQAQFESIQLTLQGDLLQSFELTDNLGQKTLIEFSQVKFNQPVDTQLFQFTPPAGVDVVEDS